MIQRTIYDAMENGVEFSISKIDKNNQVEKYGVKVVIEKTIKAIRDYNVPIVFPFNDCNETKVLSAIKSVLKFSKNENIINTSYKWEYNGKIQSSPILVVPAHAQMLSTIISGYVRYKEKMTEKASSPNELWNKDEILEKAINYICTNQTKKNTEALSLGRIRVFCMQGHGCKYGTAFPITVAMFIMRQESVRQKKPIKVIDPCAGWGDRMVAAMLLGSKYIESYIGMDPWSVSIKLCTKTKNILTTRYDIGNDVQIEIIQNSGSENKWPIKDKCDFVFTSPPYGDLEKYGCINNDDNQAWKYEDFGNDFLEPMLAQAYKKLNIDGRVAININNCKGHDDLIKIFLKSAKNVGLTLKETFGMTLSVRAPKTTFDHGEDIRRAEPIFILG